MFKPDNEPDFDRALAEAEQGTAGQLLRSARQELDPYPHFTDQLETRLKLVAARSIVNPVSQKLGQKASRIWPLLLLRAQMRVVQREIWLASALVMAVGGLVSITSSATFTSNSTLPLVLVAPLITAIGVTFLYGRDEDRMVELELAMPVSPRLVLLARLVLLFGFNLVLGMVASIAITLLLPGFSFWGLVLAWLVPMAFLSTLAFLLSVLTLDPLAGILVSLVLWTVQCGLRLTSLQGVNLLSGLPDLTAAETRPWLLVLTALFGLVALWLAGREERWLGRSRS